MGKPMRVDALQAPTPQPHAEQGEILQAVADRTRMLTGGRASAVCVLDAPNERIRVAAGSPARSRTASVTKPPPRRA